MNEVMNYDTYAQFKDALDREILSAAESFVKIGYLLKQARDTNILYESGYANLYEFAKAEYGIDKGTVSRYIAINDRFSVNGNAPVLQDRYSKRGVAKLQEMLTMSDEVIDVIPEETTKAELQDIKKDIKTEEEITDMEVMLEDDSDHNGIELDGLAGKSLYHHLKADKETFMRVCQAFEKGNTTKEDILKALAPSGIATPRTRVPKVGTVLMSIQGLEHEMAFVNVRTNETEKADWEYIKNMLANLMGESLETPKEKYMRLYGEEMEIHQEPSSAAHEGDSDQEGSQTRVDSSSNEREFGEESNRVAGSSQEYASDSDNRDRMDDGSSQEMVTQDNENVEKIEETQVEIVEEKVAPVQPVAGKKTWIYEKIKSIPDEEGEYLVCRSDYGGKMKRCIDTVKKNPKTKELEWVLWKGEVIFWMPLPELPNMAEYE